MPKFIFLDTNNWIYLSNGLNIFSNRHEDLHLKMFDFIEKRVDDGSLVLLVNDIVLREWERNKKETELKINDIQNKLKAYSQQINVMKEFIQDSDESLFNELKGKLQEKADRKIVIAKAHMVKVEDFLRNKTKNIEVPDECRIEATKLAEHKKAPFIGDKKNSMDDALILLSSITYLQKNERFTFEFGGLDDDDWGIYAESYFVSSNFGDFSHPQHKELPHPDLEPILKRSETRFYHNLILLINSLEDEFLSLEEQAAIEEVDDRIHCQLCEYEYYPTVEFSNFFEIFDPFKGSRETIDPLQMLLFKTGKQVPAPERDNGIIFTRTATCEHCGADYIECSNCRELVHIDGFNAKIACPSCDYKYILHAERDRKGIFYPGEYEIIRDYKCDGCNTEVEEVNAEGLCDECAEYEKLLEQS